MNLIKRIRQAAIAFAGLFSTSFGKTLEKKFGHIIDETPTKYDLKIDEEYIKTGIGGFTHRHFDDHAFHLMWQKVKDTLPNDTKFEEIKNYFISMSKDLQTPMGIPLHKINDKESYDQFASYMSKHFAIKKSWLLDIQSVNLSEVFGATIGVVALLFGWKKSEKERQKEERITATEPSSSGLGARLKKLRQMYKDGILSKVEFEKAKNKLLK